MYPMQNATQCTIPFALFLRLSLLIRAISVGPNLARAFDSSATLIVITVECSRGDKEHVSHQAAVNIYNRHRGALCIVVRATHALLISVLPA